MKQLFACLALAFCGAHAESNQFNDLAKAPSDVVEIAARSVSQDLFAILKADPIYQRANERRSKRGSSYSDQQVNDEVSAEASLFPGGVLGKAVVLHDPKDVFVGGPVNLSKAPDDVMDAAKRGVSQDLNVILDADAILDRAEKKRHARRLKFFDRRLSDEIAAELAVLKESIFPGGRLGDSIILEDHKDVPVLFVRIPNLNALTRVLAHPSVRAVEPNPAYVPFSPRGVSR